MNPRHPVYVISKGRWESRLTVKALNSTSVPYRVVVEPQEYDQYASVMDPTTILVLPFSNLGQGSIPARNWVWEHALSEGHAWHWILDDNLRVFYRLHQNRRYRLTSGVGFRVIEDFAERYENVALAGMQYHTFSPRKQGHPPFCLNTRIYSCILIRNDLPYRWRGRYNEDTDLSLRALKDGWCTILFYAFQVFKVASMYMSGGNTDELYKDDGRYQMALSLLRQHPDVTNIVRKWGRWQHSVNYGPFRNNVLVRKRGLAIPVGVNEYGMSLP